MDWSAAQPAKRPGFRVRQFPGEVCVGEFHIDTERTCALTEGKPVAVDPSWRKQLQKVPIGLLVDFLELTGFMPRRVDVREHVRFCVDQTVEEFPKTRRTVRLDDSHTAPFSLE